MQRNTPCFYALAGVGLAGFATVSALSNVVAGAAADTPAAFEIRALLADPALVTGGDVLAEVAVPRDASPGALKILANGRDVTSAFHPGAKPQTLVGLVSGLPTGKSLLTAAEAGKPGASLEITNYPITGPVFSGPWIQPFICQTEAFALPDGTKLGPPLDANCSARTVVQYVYRSSTPPPPAEPGAARGGRGNAAPTFKPLANLTTLPADVAKTTTTDGRTVNFIVRVETGTMNRGIYQNAILHDPTIDPAPTPATPPAGWNHRLIGVHGSGCPGGWFIQGAAMGVSPLDLARLGQGYALFVNTLNHPTNSCNAIVAAESAMMGKEHFIETFGVPLYTMTTGGSGGAYTSLQIADAFPGIFDGVSVSATFPDALAIALAGLDAHLLTHYFGAATGLTDAQKLAITGYSTIQAFVDAANQSQRTDPVPDRADIEGYQSARWNAAVPEAMRYDPVKNPKGARPTVFDAGRNIYGINKATGAALRPFDNTGVQYGLNALNAGAITMAQFLDMNEKIGGFDNDANYTPVRTAGDAGAIKRAYQSGLMLSGSGGLASIPIVDNATTNEAGGYHYGWFHFAVRERVREANAGRADNMVMWRSTTPAAINSMFDDWMGAYRSNASSQPVKTKVLAAKPARAIDGCYDKSETPAFVQDALPFSSKPVSKCSQLYPVYSNVRHEAGGPLAGNIMKCQLKPVDAREYKTAPTAAELARLNKVFPGGVCDWSKPGVNQTPVVAWASYGPSPKNLVFDVTKQ